MIIDGWLEVTPDSGGSGNTSVNVKALNPNLLDSSRVAKVDFNISDPALKKTLVVTQQAAPKVATNFSDYSGLLLNFTNNTSNQSGKSFTMQFLSSDTGIILPVITFEGVTQTAQVGTASQADGRAVQGYSTNVDKVKFTYLPSGSVQNSQEYSFSFTDVVITLSNSSTASPRLLSGSATFTSQQLEVTFDLGDSIYLSSDVLQDMTIRGHVNITLISES